MFSPEPAITSLDELCQALNSGQSARGGCPDSNAQSPESVKLPTFGGVPPPVLAGVWSWDAMRMLFSDRNGRFFIEPRDPEIWYPNK